MNPDFNLKPASHADIEELADLFWGHICAHPEYISHGEIQMGVGIAAPSGSDIPGVPAPDGRQKWLRYISANIDSPEANVTVARTQEGELAGFCVANIEEDGDAPFGMVCDVLTKEEFRGCGIGGVLLQGAIDWLRSQGIKDIYLESGLANAPAHGFFERRGFRHISEIYKLQ